MGAVSTLEQIECNEWHVLKGETQYGPYTYQEMIGMSQNGLVFGFDYVWAPHLESWAPMADQPEFSREKLAYLAEKKSAEIKSFNRREHERVTCKLSVYVNDQQCLWEGVAENLSEGGALIMIKNPALLPGNIVNIHFRSMEDGDKPFNCTAQIINKRLVKTRIKHDTGIHYAVKFMSKSADAESQIGTWIKNFKNK